MKKEPCLINLGKRGSVDLGFLTVAEAERNIPFEVKRVYWTYYTPNDVLRGGHAHKDLEQVIFAVSGSITFNIEDENGTKKTFVLNDPSIGLYLPKLIWRDIQFSHNAVLMCLASKYYTEDDYFRDYNQYKDYLAIVL